MKKIILIAVLLLGFAFTMMPVQALQLPLKNFYSNGSASGAEKFYNDSGTLYFFIYNGTNATTNRDLVSNVYHILKYDGTFTTLSTFAMPKQGVRNVTTAGRGMESIAVSDNIIYVEYKRGNAVSGLLQHAYDAFNKTSGTLLISGGIGYGTGVECNQYVNGANYMNSPFVVMPDNTTLTTTVYNGNFVVGRFNNTNKINDCPSLTAIGSNSGGETTTNAVNGTDFWVLSKAVGAGFKVFRSSNNGSTFTTVATFGGGGNSNGVRNGGYYRIYNNAVDQYFLTDATGAGYNITQLWYSGNGGVTWRNPQNISIPDSNYVSGEPASNTAQAFAYGLFRMSNGTMVIAEKRNSNLVTYQCNNNLSSCGAGTTYIPSVGSFNTDGAGNMVVKMLSGNVYFGTYPDNFVDEQPPTWSNVTTVPVSPVVKNNTNPLNVTFNITVTDNVAVDTVQIRHVGHTHATTKVGDVYTFTDEVACGITNYGWNINDTAGNANNTQNFDFQINCGTTEPTILITKPTGYYNSTTVPLVFTSYNNETIDACWFTVNDMNLQMIPICYNQTLANVSTTFVTTGGSHHTDVYANDSFGITNFSTAYFVVDVTAPAVSLTSPTGTSGSTTFTILYTVSDLGSGINTSSCYYITDFNATPVALPLCSSGSGTAPTGSHTLTVFVSDLAGNQNSAQTAFTIGLPPAVQGTTGVVYALIPLFFSLLVLFGGGVSMFRGINEGDKNALLVGAVMIIIGIVLLGVTSSLVTANLSIRTV